MPIKKEYDTYKILKKTYENAGWKFVRIEGCPGVPDIWIGKGNNYMWIEVKVYRGKKKLKDLTIKDLKFQPGQLNFARDLLLRCNKNNYRLIVFSLSGFYVTMPNSLLSQ